MVLVVKDPSASAGDARNMGSIPGGRSPKEEMATLSSILAGEFHGQRSLAGYSPWGHRELESTEQLTHSTLSSLFHRVSTQNIMVVIITYEKFQFTF